MFTLEIFAAIPFNLTAESFIIKSKKDCPGTQKIINFGLFD